MCWDKTGPFFPWGACLSLPACLHSSGTETPSWAKSRNAGRAAPNHHLRISPLRAGAGKSCPKHCFIRCCHHEKGNRRIEGIGSLFTFIHVRALPQSQAAQWPSSASCPCCCRARPGSQGSLPPLQDTLVFVTATENKFSHGALLHCPHAQGRTSGLVGSGEMSPQPGSALGCGRERGASRCWISLPRRTWACRWLLSCPRCPQQIHGCNRPCTGPG